jgi:exopolyphosphatase/guanosine-5'-triphosphate,3'-diphosphate pyrophosphatase
MRVGAIDIGTNSIRLLVADFRGSAPGEQVRTIARAGEPCRLGQGLERTGVVDGDMAARAAALARSFADRARGLGAAHVVVAATAALRSATNGLDVAERISARLGLPVRILTGEQEARLIYRAVVHGLGSPAIESACVVFDLGGGSTEVVSGVRGEVGRWTSMGFGAVSLTERFLRSDPPAPAELDALGTQVREDIMHECAYMPRDTAVLAGVGGTVTVLAMLDRGLTDYHPTLLEGWLIRRERLEDLVHRIVHTTQADRRTWPAMGEGRADIVVAGALVVKHLADRFPSVGLVCSTQGLRFGLARMAAEEAAGGRPKGG